MLRVLTALFMLVTVLLANSSTCNAGGPVEAQLSLRFVTSGPLGAETWVAGIPGFLDTSLDREVSSLVPVAPKNCYVELRNKGISVAGTWSTADGNVEFLLPGPLAMPLDLSLRYLQNQSMSIADGSVHRLTAGRDVNSSPGVFRSPSYIFTSVVNGSGSVSTRRWSVSTGSLGGSSQNYGAPSSILSQPQPIYDEPLGRLLLIAGRKVDSQYQVVKFDSSGQMSGVSSPMDKSQHVAAALGQGSSVVTRYTWWLTGALSAVAHYEMSTSGSNGSAESRYLDSPPVLSNLALCTTSQGAVFMAGDSGNQVYLYRGTRPLYTFGGARPSVALCGSGGSERVLLTYLAPGENGSTMVMGAVFAPDGARLRAPVMLCSIPVPPNSVGRLSSATREQNRVWLFWDQPFHGANQVFFTSVTTEVN